jgi:hypothetical protein
VARTLHLQAGEVIEVFSPRGDASVRIAFTPDGPVVTLGAARVELHAQDLAVRCNRLDLQATEEVRIASQGDIHIDGASVRLNCER